MSEFLVKQLTYDLSSQAGLALIGKYLKRINLNALVDPAFAVRAGIANSDILKSYLGLLCLGKNDFDAIEAQRTDAFFTRALHLRTVPSSPTLRQRFDTHASDWFELAERINAAVLSVKIAGKPINFGLLPCGYLPLDVDTFAMDNSGTAKEHVGRTYTGTSPVEAIAAKRVADAATQWVSERAGKRECLWQDALDLVDVGSDINPARRVYRLTERTIDKHGNALLLPEYVLEGWTTTLPQRFGCAEVIALYCDHGTHEQFHSEFKTDMDLERLPSGKFDTNYLVCALAAVAMNLLRLIGQNTLHGPDAPVRHKAKRGASRR
jgi:hypothetical protein